MKMNRMSVMVILILTVLPTVVIPSSSKCLQSINTGCDSTIHATYEELVDTCCKALKDAADSERKCFCDVLGNADESYNTLLTTCEIPGTVDSLCPGSGSGKGAPSGATTKWAGPICGWMLLFSGLFLY